MASLPGTARVVVIGGGVVGASMLYHLTELGCTDAVLLERSELSAGTTWGSSAMINHVSTSPLLLRLHVETLALYSRLEDETDQSTALRITGSLRFAETPERMTEYVRCRALAHHLGVPFELVGVDEIKALHPLVATDGLIGAAHTPEDGFVDPSSATQALAQAARAAGAQVHRGAPVRDLRRAAGGRWEVVTDGGTISAEVVVNAAGMWAPELGRMVGLWHPIIAFQRQYFLTEDIPLLKEPGRKAFPVIRDPEGTFYAREEMGAFLVGPYERKPLFWGVDGIPEGFAHESLPSFLDQATEPVEAALARLPILNEVGIRTVVNVPTSRTPDHNPLVGPVRGLPGYWLAAGFFGGVSSASLCRYLARWILDGEPGIDMSSFDPRRFGDHVDKRYAIDRIRERHIIGLVQAVGYPFEEMKAARPAKTGALYDLQRARGAVFGMRAGWEVPLWFAPEGVEPADQPSFRRTNWFPHVAAECRAVAEGVGLIDQTATARFEVSGPDAAAFLDRLCANDLPRSDGEVVRTPLLSPAGAILAVVAVARLGPTRFYLTAPMGGEIALLDWLERNLGDGQAVTLDNLSGAWGTLTLAGPEAREVLAQLTDGDLSPNAFAVGSAREVAVGYAPSRVMRTDATGAETWEVHHPIAYQRALHGALMEAGQARGIALVGARALESLLLEVGLPGPAPNLYGGMTPAAAGLEALVGPGKTGFIGQEALGPAPERRLVTLAVAAEDADAYGAEPVFDGARSVALVATGGYGHRTATSLAMAALPRELAAPGVGLAVEILGQRRPAQVVAPPLGAPSGS